MMFLKSKVKGGRIMGNNSMMALSDVLNNKFDELEFIDTSSKIDPK